MSAFPAGSACIAQVGTTLAEIPVKAKLGEMRRIIVPLRTHGGQRRYSGENITIVEEIIRLMSAPLSLPKDVTIDNLNNFWLYKCDK